MARRPPTKDKRDFNPSQISASRVNAYLSCGQAFEMKYIQNLPEQVSGSAALFGLVIHHALERWAINRKHDLVTLMSQAWLAETEGTSVNDFIGAYQAIAVEVLRAEKTAAEEFLSRNGRETKAVRMTASFKKSKAFAKEQKLLAEWLPRLEKDSPWRFTERDPLPALYNESLVLAKKYAARWANLPDAWVTEFGFDVKFHDFILNGYIDSIEPLVNADGEIEAMLVVDYKTYAKEPAEQKDWRQVVMYDVAVRQLIEREALLLPVDDLPILVCLDYPRLLERKYWRITEKDHDRLATELRMYRAGVSNGVFLPAEKGRNPDFCPYPENCCLRTKGEGCAIPVEVAQ